MSNIAEGAGRNSNPEFRRFLTIAAGSAAELESQLIQSRDLDYISEQIFIKLSFEIQEIRKMLDRFIKYLENEIRQKGRIR